MQFQNSSLNIWNFGRQPVNHASLKSDHYMLKLLHMCDKVVVVVVRIACCNGQQTLYQGSHASWKVLESPGFFFGAGHNCVGADAKMRQCAEKPLNFLVQSAVYSLRERTTNVYICEKLSDILVISQ